MDHYADDDLPTIAEEVVSSHELPSEVNSVMIRVHVHTIASTLIM